METRVVVLGAGYAGLAASRLIARYPGVAVTLVNPREHFTERVRLHQIAAGGRVPRKRIAGLLSGSGVAFTLGEAVAIDTAAGKVALADGTRLPYDQLVYALGSRSATAGVPGVETYAYPLAVAGDGERLRARLAVSESVLVVGGGLTGIETATELAACHPGLAVTLVTGGVLGKGFSANGRAHLLRVCARLGITVREECVVREVGADGVRVDPAPGGAPAPGSAPAPDGAPAPGSAPALDGGRSSSAAAGDLLRADTVVWTAGFGVPDLARDAGFAVDPRGRMRVDPSLRSVSHPSVYAIGDAAALQRQNGQRIRMACATALPAAAHAARSIGERLAGREPGPLRFRYLNQCVSLGCSDALVQFVRADDSPVERVLTGRSAALYKEAVVRGALLAQRRPVLTRLQPRDGRPRA